MRDNSTEIEINETTEELETITVTFRGYEIMPYDDDSYAYLHVIKDRYQHILAINYGCVVPPSLSEGTVLELTGSFRSGPVSEDFPFLSRRTFDFCDIRVVMPVNEAAAVNYVENLGIRTIKENAAKLIVKETGCDILGFFETHSDVEAIAEEINQGREVCKKKIVTVNSLRQLITKVAVSTKGYDFFKLIHKHGFLYKEAVDLYAKVEQSLHKCISAEECLNALRPDATGMRWSIYSYDMNFTATDRLAFDLSYSPYTPERIERLVQQVLQANEVNGHTWISFDAICRNINNARYSTPYPDDIIPVDMINSAIMRRTDFFNIEQSEDGTLRVYTAEMWKHEQSAAANILRLHGQTRRLAYDESVIAMAEAEIGVSYSPEQKKGFNLIATTGVKLLTGGAGTGKTTTISAMIWAYHKFNPDKKIALCAPTGRAAQRLTELCRKFPDIFADDTREAMTIHRLLKFAAGSGNIPQYGPDKKLPYDLIIVDEMSMLDTEIFDLLVRAVNDGSLLILCGDADQLPSVGAGNVFRELIHSNIFDTVRLTTNYRQSTNGESASRILINANRANEGISDFEMGDDFNVICCPNDTNIAKTAIDYISIHRDAAVLSPIHKGVAGINALNSALQPIINPDGVEHQYGERKFRNGDIVLYTRNNYNLGLSNGDIGIVADGTPSSLTVQFDGKSGTTVIKNRFIDDVVLAYAMSIHKSQGSEYNNVIIVLPSNASSMMARNLLYTALTRAKKRITVITVEGMIKKAIDTVRADDRRTTLGQFLAEQTYDNI